MIVSIIGKPYLLIHSTQKWRDNMAKEPKKNAFEKKFGEGTAFDLDYGKLLIIGLCVYIAVQVS